MNLHGLAKAAIGTVNPFESVTWRQSTGNYTTAANGERTPLYDTATISAQIQALDSDDLKLLDGINMQGTHRKMYFFGEVDGIIRSAQKGGDLITRPDGTVWLATRPIEQWPDWCSILLTLENDGT